MNANLQCLDTVMLLLWKEYTHLGSRDDTWLMLAHGICPMTSTSSTYIELITKMSDAYDMQVTLSPRLALDAGGTPPVRPNL